MVVNVVAAGEMIFLMVKAGTGAIPHQFLFFIELLEDSLFHLFVSDTSSGIKAVEYELRQLDDLSSGEPGLPGQFHHLVGL